MEPQLRQLGLNTALKRGKMCYNSKGKDAFLVIFAGCITMIIISIIIIIIIIIITIIIIIMKITTRTWLLRKTALLGTGRVLRKVLES